MPHLQDTNDAEKNTQSSVKGTAATLADIPSSSPDLPIKEAREGYLSGSEGLKTLLAASASKQSKPEQVSFESTEDERTQVETSTPSQSNHTPKQMITPSPYGALANRAPPSPYGPMLSIYGNNRLFPSPIRVKKRTPSSDDEKSAGGNSSPGPQMGTPTHLRYGGVYAMSTPSPKCVSRQASQEGVEKESPSNKRPITQIQFNDAMKKAKMVRSGSPGPTGSDLAQINEVPAKKKPIISPTPSGEKGGDEESTRSPTRAHRFPAGPYSHPHYPPHLSPYPPHAPHAYGVPPPHFPAGYPMYGAYPPPPHYMHGHPAGHPPAFYPHYPPPHMMHHYRPHSKVPPHFPGPHRAGPPTGKAAMGMVPVAPPATAVKTEGQPGQEERTFTKKGVAAIHSVAEWQRAALSNGKPPSANRCVPLNEPIPSKYWGEAEKTKDAVLPDFHRLVNYPDYLLKARNSSSEGPNTPTPAGKKHCVMCGKLRVCSASTLVNRGRAAKQDESSAASQEEDDDCTAHIIPRQNKGLCTACDVSVWVFTADGLEIKWCKGCKNFRPWAAFGDKGSATKCTRCRDRQREKYALQKDEIKQRRYKRTSSSDSMSVSSSVSAKKSIKEEQDADQHLAAARGLQTLIHAAAV